MDNKQESLFLNNQTRFLIFRSAICQIFQSFIHVNLYFLGHNQIFFWEWVLDVKVNNSMRNGTSYTSPNPGWDNLCYLRINSFENGMNLSLVRENFILKRSNPKWYLVRQNNLSHSKEEVGVAKWPPLLWEILWNGNSLIF